MAAVANGALNKDLQGFKVTTDQSASGLGDQASFLAGSGSSTQQGVVLIAKADVLYVIDGGVFFDVTNLTHNSAYTGTIDSLGSVSDATIESEFEQIAQSVIAAL